MHRPQRRVPYLFGGVVGERQQRAPGRGGAAAAGQGQPFHGCDARRLAAGIAEWKADGHDLERIPNPPLTGSEGPSCPPAATPPVVSS